jgi:hypothetical protein
MDTDTASKRITALNHRSSVKLVSVYISAAVAAHPNCRTVTWDAQSSRCPVSPSGHGGRSSVCDDLSELRALAERASEPIDP